MGQIDVEPLLQNIESLNAGPLQPLKRKNLAEQAAEELRKLILLEKLKPGAAIPEREYADALGVSRTPLREALRLLAGEGLVEIVPGRVPRVSEPTLEEVKHLLEVQGALEALAGELACTEAGDAEIAAIAQLERSMHELPEGSDPLIFFERDMAFHRAIVSACGNAPLGETHATYNARLWRARFISSLRKPNRERALREHREIVEALARRDAAATSEALRQHLVSAFENISAAMRESAAGKGQA